MNKLFLTICFSFIFFSNAHAAVREVIDQAQNQPPQKPKEVSQNEMEDFLSERLEKALIMDEKDVTTFTSNAQPSDITLKANQNANKTTFQKIYENALKKLDSKIIKQPSEINHQNILRQHKQAYETKVRLNFPTINISIPQTNKVVKVPAEEHIPHLISKIDILPGGSVKFTDTITVIANNNKLKNGLTKILPKYIVSRNKDKRRINYTLIGVSANGQNIPYKLNASLNNIILSPETTEKLEAGVYTYKFEYLADGLLWKYDDFNEFYWDIIGNYWNLVVTRSGATLSLPEGILPISNIALIGNANKIDKNPTNIITPSPQNWGYASTRPLLPTEGIHLILSLPDSPILQPSFSKKIMLHFNNYSDLYISLFTLIAIILSFGISWKYIKANKGQLKISLKKTPVLMRFLAFNRYDIKSFGGFLLDLYRKNIIDIQQSDDTVLLVKRTDNLKSLSISVQKAVNQLFTQNEPVLNVNKNNRLKIMRAAKVIERDLHRTLLIFLLKLNSGYLFFSLGMILVGISFISLMETNTKEIFTILSGGTLAIGLGIFLFTRSWKNLILSITTKALGMAIIILAIVCLAAIVSLWCIFFIIAGLTTIYYYTTSYTQRNGLLKSYIEDAVQQKEKIMKNHDNILLGKEIIIQQPYIWVLDLEDEFITSNYNEYNKLSALKAMIQNKLK